MFFLHSANKYKPKKNRGSTSLKFESIELSNLNCNAYYPCTMMQKQFLSCALLLEKHARQEELCAFALFFNVVGTPCL